MTSKLEGTYSRTSVRCVPTLRSAKQQDLILTPPDQPEITVDNIEVAQFVYLLLRNERIRDVIDTITSKAVLILGRFTDEHKAPGLTGLGQKAVSDQWAIAAMEGS